MLEEADMDGDVDREYAKFAVAVMSSNVIGRRYGCLCDRGLGL